MTAQTIIQWLWQWSWQGSTIIGLVLMIRWIIFRGPLIRRRSMLWLIVLARLLLPVHPPSSVSVFNLPQWIGSLQWPQTMANSVPAVESKTFMQTNQRITVGYGPAPLTLQMPEHTALPSHVERHEMVTALMLIWLLGVIGMLARTAYSQIRFSNRLRRVRASEDPMLLTALHDAARWMHIANPPPLLVTDIAASPAISGVLQPRLLLSPSSAKSLTPSQLRHVFLHELAHLKRGDLWIDLLCTLLLAAQWFNPLAWLAFSLYRSDREIARDAMALDAAPNGLAENYGGTIVTLLERISGYPSLPAGALGILERGGGLRQRMVAITEHQPHASAWRSRLFVVAIISVVAIACLTSCKQPSEQETATTTTAPNTSKPGVPETRTYDISDLLVDIPDFDNAPALSGIPPATTRPSQPQQQSMTRDEKIRALIKLFQDTIDPDSWKQYASVRENAQHLIIYQSHENQEEIAHLLEKIRESRGVEITVEARFIELDAKQSAARTGIMPPVRGNGTYLDDKQVTALLKYSEATKGNSELASPRITLFNGQRAWVCFANQQNYVSDLKATRQPSGEVTYAPVVSQLSTGVLLDCQATVSSDRKYVTVTLRPQISTLRGLRTQRWKAAPPNHKDDLFVQVPEVTASSLQTTCSIPSGGTLFLPLMPTDVPEGMGAMPTTNQNVFDMSSIKPGEVYKLPPEQRKLWWEWHQAQQNHPATAAAKPPIQTFILVRATVIVEKEKNSRK